MGANVGDWAGMTLSRFPHLTRLVAYEPGPVVDTLAARIGDDERVTIVNAAVSDNEGTIAFVEDPVDDKLSSAVITGRPSTRAVSRVRLDDELEVQQIGRVDFLKIVA